MPLFVDQVQLRNGLEHPAPPPHRPGSVNGASPEIPDPTWTQTCIYINISIYVEIYLDVAERQHLEPT